MTNSQFAVNAERLIGKPYSEVDCIGVVRQALGIRCQGTNWLWRSVNNGSKYKYLSKRVERPIENWEIQNGIVVFKINWSSIPQGYTDTPNAYHVGVLSNWNVIQSNPSTGVIRSHFEPSEWQGFGYMKQVEYQSIPYSDELPFDDQPPDENLLEQIYINTEEILRILKERG